MSGVGSVNSNSSSNPLNGTLGDTAPVSFPGVASGIDYNAIIQKYTAATLAGEAPYLTKVSEVNKSDAEILKIQNLLGKVQDSLKTISNPQTFQSFAATPSVAGNAVATQTQNAIPVAGTYTINAQTTATATQVTSDAAAGAPANFNAVLTSAGLAITPTNGTGANGTFTINGVTLSYNVSTTTLNGFIAQINGVTGSTGVTATATANGVTLTSTPGTKIALGSATDSGNLLQVLHFDTAQIQNNVPGAGQQTIASAGPIGGLNQTATLNAPGNAGFATAVTAGTFTINGVQFTVDPTKDAVKDIITRINGSSAGVVAAYNTTSGQITITNGKAGAQNIILGSASDSSNFLGATGLTTASGYTPAINVGTQATVTYTDSTGPHTVYSQTNDFTNVINGIDLTIQVSTATPYTVAVTTDSKVAETAINTFVTAYNNAINELNNATAAPTFQQGFSASAGTNKTTQQTKGGVLYGNFQVQSLRDQLVSSVSSLVPTGSTTYNSLASIGLQLDTSRSQLTTSDSNDSTNSSSDSNNNTVVATSGQLAALDTAKFEAALAANPQVISTLFTAFPPGVSSTSQSSGTPPPRQSAGIAYNLGALLTSTTGLPTILQNGIAGYIPAQGLLASLQSANQAQLTLYQSQISLITREANQQADQLRAQFTSSETLIAQYQALQGQISQIGR